MIPPSLKTTLLALIPLLSTGAQAEFLVGDWQTAGDNLVIEDTATSLEWLNLSQTLGLSVNQVAAQLDSTYRGWRLPSRGEVNQLLNSFFPTLDLDTVYGGRAYPGSTTGYINLFGNTYGAGGYANLGFFVNDQQESLGGSAVLTHAVMGSAWGQRIDTNVSWNGGHLDSSNGIVGVYLVRGEAAAVPLPTGLGLVGLGLLAVAGGRQRRAG